MFDMVGHKSDSVVVEYESDSSMSVSSEGSSATSTPASRSPVPLEFKVGHMGSWITEAQCPTDPQMLIAKNAQEVKVISFRKNHAIASMNQIGMFDDSTPANPSVPLLALHRGRNLDNLDLADEEGRVPALNGSEKLKGTLIHRARIEPWKVLRVAEEDIERQGPINRSSSVLRCLRQLLKGMVLIILFGFAIMTCYSSWVK